MFFALQLLTSIVVILALHFAMWVIVRFFLPYRKAKKLPFHKHNCVNKFHRVLIWYPIIVMASLLIISGVLKFSPAYTQHYNTDFLSFTVTLLTLSLFAVTYLSTELAYHYSDRKKYLKLFVVDFFIPPVLIMLFIFNV